MVDKYVPESRQNRVVVKAASIQRAMPARRCPRGPRSRVSARGLAARGKQHAPSPAAQAHGITLGAWHVFSVEAEAATTASRGCGRHSSDARLRVVSGHAALPPAGSVTAELGRSLATDRQDSGWQWHYYYRQAAGGARRTRTDG